MKDLEGMVRKKRECIGFICCWIASVFVGLLIINAQGIISILALFVLVFVTYEAIKAIVTYDIDTWTHSKYVKLYLFIGCFGGIIIGIVVYFHLRKKELESDKHGI